MAELFSASDSDPMPLTADPQEIDQWFDRAMKLDNKELLRQAKLGADQCAAFAQCISDDSYRDLYFQACQARHMIEYLKQARYLIVG